MVTKHVEKSVASQHQLLVDEILAKNKKRRPREKESKTSWWKPRKPDEKSL